MIRPNRKTIITLLAFFLLLGGGNILLKTGPDQKQKKNIASYLVNAEQGQLPSIISASGQVQAKRSLDVNPFSQGIIEKMYVKEGDEVIENQLLAKLEDRDLQFKFNELEAQYQNQKQAFERRKDLFLQGGISEEKYEGFEKDFLISKAKLEQIKVQIEELYIKAPFHGVITAKFAEPGTFVSPSSRQKGNETSIKNSIVEISQGIEVLSKVPESDIGRIQIGQKGSIRIEAFPEERFQSIVSEISPRAIRSNNVTSFEVKLSLVNPPKKIRIGMTADIEFKTDESDLKTIVPTVAIVTKEGQPGLLIVGKNMEPLFKKVELGSSSGNKTAIINGITPGEKVFIEIPPWSKRKRN